MRREFHVRFCEGPRVKFPRSAVARWDGDLGVYVDAAALAHALALAGACRFHDAKERTIASEVVARGRCTAEPIGSAASRSPVPSRVRPWRARTF